MSPSNFQFSTFVILALFTVSSLVAQEVAPEKPNQRRPLVEAKAFSLEEMTKAADIVFQGKVKDVRQEEQVREGPDGKKISYKVYVVRFDVEKKLKGDIAMGEPLVVRQLPAAYIPVEKGEEVLWYLSKPGKSGFTAPLGLYSGNFKIKPDPNEANAKVAVNMNNNKGLWSNQDQHSLYTGADKDSFKEDFRQALSEKANVTPERKNKILQLSNKPNRPGALPLELIESATESLLK